MGKGHPGPHLGSRHRWEPGRSHLGAHVPSTDHAGDREVLQHDEGGGEASRGELLHHGPHDTRVGAQTTERGRDDQAVEPGVGQGVEQLHGHEVGAVGDQRARQQHLVGQPPGSLDDLSFMRGHLRDANDPPKRCHGSATRRSPPKSKIR